MGSRNDGIGDLVRGALAGLVATWAMGQVTAYLYEREGEEARQREDDARDGKTAYGVAAEKAAGAVGRELTDDERAQAGSAIHWGLGVAAGAAYGAIRHRVPLADAAGGALFGTVFFLAMDELATPALGLTPGPTAFPWQTHARGLAGHVVFGLATELTLQALDRVT